MPLFEAKKLERNSDKLTRPIETMAASYHYVFSHGHLLKVAGHDGSFDNVSMVSDEWEQMWMTYMYWKKGYTLYSPNVESIYYNYLNVDRYNDTTTE